MSSAIENVPREDRRASLSRERVLAAAIDLADRDGFEALSMRSLGQALGIEAMSLYTHVRGREDLLDGMADAIVGRVPLKVEGADDVGAELPAGWTSALRATILGARSVLLQHPWAARVIETRSTAGPATIAYMDRVAGILREGGFSIELAHHALHSLGSRVLGFNQDLFDDKADVDPAMFSAMAEELSRTFPNVGAIAMAASHEGGLGGCDDDYEFAFGLDLVLDGLEVRRTEARAPTATAAPAPAPAEDPLRPLSSPA